MATPLPKPISAATARPAAIETISAKPGKGWNAAWLRPAMVSEVTVAVSAIVEPTERSMPPVMITSVMPSVAMAMNEKLRTMLPTLPAVRKFGDAKLMKTIRTISAAST